jgi:hypothetical protein
VAEVEDEALVYLADQVAELAVLLLALVLLAVAVRVVLVLMVIVVTQMVIQEEDNKVAVAVHLPTLAVAVMAA